MTLPAFLSHIVPLLRGHGVNVINSLLVDSRTDIEITWAPEDVLPLDDDPNSYTVDVIVYVYEYKERIRGWKRKSVNSNLPNNGHAHLQQINFSKKVKVVCIQVAAGETVGKSNDPATVIINSLNALNNKPFPSQAGIWSGLLFSIKTSRSAPEKDEIKRRNEKLDKECSRWNDNQERMLRSNNVFASLPACPPTQDRAELPNSGLEEARFDSVLYTTDYHNQWMDTFHRQAAICFTQATVARQVKF